MPGRQLSPLLLAVVVLALALSARADNIEIQGGKNSKLEIRNITLPDGSETKLYVLRGDNVKVTIGEDTIVADYIEFDFENDLVRIVGPFKFVSDTETITGRDFVLDLSEETFQGKDVLIVSTAIDVSGAEALRSPGQIDVLQGSFSPCSRCGQQVEDYGFAAHRLVLYPGDRLVAFDVTVLIRNAAVFYLPLMVIPLGPQDRQPQLSITSGTATERAEIQLDWPYVVGANAFGFTSLHYYADVVPGQGNFITENLLGGAIATSYFGGG
ncbi:MAG TPA: hypothetical protein VF171_07525, partial [Trueperaceae bacterium]